MEGKMGSEDESIEQAVASRRERLLALRAAQELSNAPEAETEAEPEANDNNNGDDQGPEAPGVAEGDTEEEYVFFDLIHKENELPILIRVM